MQMGCRSAAWDAFVLDDSNTFLVAKPTVGTLFCFSFSFYKGCFPPPVAQGEDRPRNESVFSRPEWPVVTKWVLE